MGEGTNARQVMPKGASLLSHHVAHCRGKARHSVHSVLQDCHEWALQRRVRMYSYVANLTLTCSTNCPLHVMRCQHFSAILLL